MNITDNNGVKHQIITELDEGLVDQLVEQSHTDKVLLEFTPKDQIRFADKAQAQKYLSIRNFYFAKTADDKLSGLIWFSEKIWPIAGRNSPDYSFAIRVYEPFRDRGLSTIFTETVLDLLKNKTKAKEVWLDVDSNNQPALNLYQRTGWEKVGEEFVEAKNMRRVFMVRRLR